MTAEQKAYYMNLAIALAIVYGVYRFSPIQAAKAMALGVGGVIISKNIPYVKAVV